MKEVNIDEFFEGNLSIDFNKNFQVIKTKIKKKVHNTILGGKTISCETISFTFYMKN